MPLPVFRNIIYFLNNIKYDKSTFLEMLVEENLWSSTQMADLEVYSGDRMSIKTFVRDICCLFTRTAHHYRTHLLG